jgi:hypothetical protein
MMEANALSQALQIAQNGSPQILHAAGRMFGLGEAEREALSQGQVPRWAIGVLGLSVGLVAGIAIHRRWPKTADKMMGR